MAAKLIAHESVRPTRYRELGYQHRGDHWRIIDLNDRPEAESGIGPHYRTKSELLADLDRYAQQFGCAN